MSIAQSFAKRRSEIQAYWQHWQRTLQRFTGVVVRELSKKRSKFLWDRRQPEDDNGTYDQAAWNFGLVEKARRERLPPPTQPPDSKSDSAASRSL